MHWIPYDSEYGTGGHYVDDSYFYDRGYAPPSVARLPSGDANPFYDQQTYDPQGYNEMRRVAELRAGSRRRGGFGFLDRIGEAFENNVTQRLEPFVQNVADEIATPQGIIATVALMAGIPYFSGMTEASLAAAAESAGISSAELAALKTQAANVAGSGAGTTNALTMAGTGAPGFQTTGTLANAGGFGGATFGGPTTLSAAQAALAAAANAAPASAASAGANALRQAAQAAAPAAASAATANGLSNFLGPALGAASQIAGGYMANNAITDAANTAAASADKNIAFQREIINAIRADQEPFRAAGVSAIGKLGPLMDYKKFSMNDFMADPGYQFRLTQGQQALDRSAAARAGLQSGSALKAATAFGQEMGSQEFNNAFNRYGIERERAINPLLSMAGFGQTATNNLQQGAQNFGNTAGTIMGNAGNTQANAQLARGSVYANTGNQLAEILGRYGRS